MSFLCLKPTFMCFSKPYNSVFKNNVRCLLGNPQWNVVHWRNPVRCWYICHSACFLEYDAEHKWCWWYQYYGDHGGSPFCTEIEFDSQDRSSSVQKLSSTHRIEVHLYRTGFLCAQLRRWGKLNLILGETNCKSVSLTWFLWKKMSLRGFRKYNPS